MANVKITDLTALSASDVADTDVFVLVDVNADQTKKLTVADAKTSIAAANDFVTYTQLNANLNTTTANVTAVEARRVANIAGAISTVLTGDLTASRAMVTNGSGKIAVSDVTATELGYVDGVTSAIQTQFTGAETRRTANIAGAISSVLTSDLTASRAMVSDGSGKIAILSGVTSTELGYVDATSSIQTQMDTKIATTASASNDYVTYTRLNANIDIVQDNVASASSNAISSGDTVVNTIDPIITFVANGNEAGRFTTNGNLFLGTTGASGYFLDVRGTANVGALTTTGITIGSAEINETELEILDGATLSTTELNYVDGVTSAIQTQFTGAETRRTNNIAGAISTVLTGDLTASRAMVVNGSGKIAVSDVTATELGYVDGVTSAIQTQFTGAETRRTNNIAGAISSVLTSDLTASRAMVSDGSGKISILSGVTSTELGYVDATSSIQTQLDAKAALAGATFTGQVNFNDDAVITGNLTVNGDTITANAVNLIVQDQFIALSNGGTVSTDVGIFYNRGTSGNAAIWYDASAYGFYLSETRDPFSNTTVSPTGAANLTMGVLTAAELDISGDVDVDGTLETDAFSINGTAVTSTAAELNGLDGLTASRALEVNGSGILTASDITATELGYLDGVSSAIQTQLDAKAATTALALSNILHTTTSVNSYATGSTTSSIDKVFVYLNGIYQNEKEYVLGNSTHNVQFKDSTLTSGLELEIRKF